MKKQCIIILNLSIGYYKKVVKPKQGNPFTLNRHIKRVKSLKIYNLLLYKLSEKHLPFTKLI